ncbi:MAG: MBL fold metallo-hydrolase [Chloroflexi bacterium]|nr:MBL fold metallo-hydrolase [Chloroflexota bacterium]
MAQVYRFNIGTYECVVLNDGNGYGTAEMMFNNAPQDLVQADLETYGEDPERIPYANSCLVVNTGDHLVLIDTGFGVGYQVSEGNEPKGMVLQNLAQLGLSPEKFDFVILTHHHYDHLGGCSDGMTPTFPNAKHLIWKSEWDLAMTTEAGRERLIPIRNLVQFLDRDTEIAPGVSVLAAQGHTLGHTIVSIRSGDKELLYLSDLVVHPLHIEFPDWYMFHEQDLERVSSSRRSILGKARENNTLLHVFHFEFPGLGHVTEQAGILKWQPSDHV